MDGSGKGVTDRLYLSALAVYAALIVVFVVAYMVLKDGDSLAAAMSAFALVFLLISAVLAYHVFSRLPKDRAPEDLSEEAWEKKRLLREPHDEYGGIGRRSGSVRVRNPPAKAPGNGMLWGGPQNMSPGRSPVGRPMNRLAPPSYAVSLPDYRLRDGGNRENVQNMNS